MSASPTHLTLDQALKNLKSYDCVKTNTEKVVELEEIRNSLLLVKNLSPSLNLGICADNSQQGLNTLASYLKAFGYQGNVEPEKDTESSESVYLKFSTQKMAYYSDKYTGEFRGVLSFFPN